MKNIALSTSAFCLWDIEPEEKLQICKDLGFKSIVLAFSTIKMLNYFASSDKLCKQLSYFTSITLHAPWRGIRYKDNKASKEIVALLKCDLKKSTYCQRSFSF